jgi:tetratricopeptide (TPR) repeat protein
MRTRTRLRRLVPVAVLAGLVAGCSPDQIMGSNTLPPDVPDPAHAKTPEGALAAYRGAVGQFGKAFGGQGGVIVPGALLTDELQDGSVGLAGSSDTYGWMYADARSLPEYSDPSLDPSGGFPGTPEVAYGTLQRARGQISQALGALRAYAPDAPVALQGRLYALEGYAEIFLADLYCSGVPLSTLDFDGDFTYQPGSSTAEVYQRAVAHFDSALALAADSAPVMHLARVGKARALLALGEYQAAAEAVADVPDDFQYAFGYRQQTASNAGGEADVIFTRYLAGDYRVASGYVDGAMMTDREGTNGLPFVSSHDPRTPADSLGVTFLGVPKFLPPPSSLPGDTVVVLSSGSEARLIQAEVQLHADDAGWLTTLNALRTDGTYDTQPDPNDPAQTDTLWHAGIGGVAGLAPLADPGDPNARVDLLFQERGYWLFLTAHRQGDLRRLVREYGRNPESVYPTGRYGGLDGQYGTAVNAPIPATERIYNPQFHGCLNRGA